MRFKHATSLSPSHIRRSLSQSKALPMEKNSRSISLWKKLTDIRSTGLALLSTSTGLTTDSTSVVLDAHLTDPVSTDLPFLESSKSRCRCRMNADALSRVVCPKLAEAKRSVAHLVVPLHFQLSFSLKEPLEKPVAAAAGAPQRDEQMPRCSRTHCD